MHDQYALWKIQESQKFNKNNKILTNFNKQHCRQVKQNWITEECQKAELLHVLPDSVNFCRKIKQITDTIKKIPRTRWKIEFRPCGSMHHMEKVCTVVEEKREARKLNWKEWSGPDSLESEVQKTLKTLCQVITLCM